MDAQPSAAWPPSPSKRTARIWLGLATVVALTGCTGPTIFGMRGSGEVTSETRDVGAFTEVVLEGTGTVDIQITGNETLVIEAEDNLMPELTSEVVNGKLVLGTRRSIAPTRDIVYTITAANLDGITVSGSGDVTAEAIDSSVFAATINGSGSIDLTGATLDRLEATISGSGDIESTGNADEIHVAIPGSGVFRGEDMTVSVGQVDISGSGTAVVNVSQTLDATVSGSGSIEYLGSPTVSSDISGSGSVSQR